MLETLGRLGAGIAGLWALVVVLAAVFQRSLIYLPDPTAPTPPPDAEPVAVHTPDGLELAAWFFPTDAEPVSTVLYLPGNAGNRAGRVPSARELNRRGHQVLLVDYRGYGGNPGTPSEEGLIIDGTAAYDHLAARADVDAGRIVVLGESIGTGVAAAVAAAREPPAAVLRSPFPDLAAIGRRAYPFLPVRTLLRDRFATAERLIGTDVEVLVVAGGADGIVPPTLSGQVAEQLDSAYLEIPRAGHNDPALFTGDAYLDAVDAHIRSTLCGQSGSDG